MFYFKIVSEELASADCTSEIRDKLVIFQKIKKKSFHLANFISIKKFPRNLHLLQKICQEFFIDWLKIFPSIWLNITVDQWLSKDVSRSSVLVLPSEDDKFILDPIPRIRRIRKDHLQFLKNVGKRKIYYCITRKELLAVIKSVQNFNFTENFCLALIDVFQQIQLAHG